MSVFVKICGVCSRGDLERICVLNPDAVGFVFWPRAKRYVRPEQVCTWTDAMPEQVRRVGVFVEPSSGEVESIAAACRLDVIQIHLVSNDWQIDRPLFSGLEVWLAPRMRDGVDASVLQAVRPEPSALLADSFDPVTVGGTGRQASREQAIALKDQLGKPLVLAGGLTPDNVEEAITAVRPWGVDVSTGVEIKTGVKDLRKVEQFILAARRCG